MEPHEAAATDVSAPDDSNRNPPFPAWVAPVLLIVLGIAVYGVSMRGDFLNWDDPRYVLENPEFQLPFWDAVGRIFSTPYFVNYNPLHRLSYLIELRLFGESPQVMRSVNVALHVLTGWLAYGILLRWLARPWVALAGAALFVVHPAAVESVAWISSRKTVLASAFGFGALLMWLRSDESPRARPIALALFVLALLSKVSVVVLPGALVLFDLARRKRLRIGWYAAFGGVAVTAGIAQIWAASTGDGIRELHGGSVLTHVATLIGVMPAYAGSVLLPFGHAARRSFDPVTAMTDPRLWAGVALLIAYGVACVRSWRAERRVLFALLWFVAVLLPTLVVPIPIIHADRYVYLALPFLLGVIADASARAPLPQARPLQGAVAAWGLALAIGGGLYAGVWGQSLSLWTHSIERYPADRESWELLGFALGKQGNLDGARQSFEEAARIAPDHDETQENLAYFSMQCGEFDRAILALRSVVERSPERPSAWAALGVALDLSGRPDEAASVFEEALRKHPMDDQVRTNFVEFERRRESS